MGYQWCPGHFSPHRILGVRRSDDVNLPTRTARKVRTGDSRLQPSRGTLYSVSPRCRPLETRLHGLPGDKARSVLPRGNVRVLCLIPGSVGPPWPAPLVVGGC